MMPESDLRARAYLLGTLSDDRAAALEQALMTDPTLVDHVQQVEHDLVDDYVDNRLPLDERARFETHYLASQRHRDRVAVSRALAAIAQQTHPRARSTFGVPRYLWVWASAAALLLVVAGWLAVRRPGVPAGDPTAPRVAETPTSPAPLTTAPPATGPSATVPVRVALLLSPVTTRDRAATTPRLAVPAEAAFVDLQLDGPPAGRTPAAAEIRSVDDRVAWTGPADPAPDARPSNTPSYAWIVHVPADRLTADDYILTLSDARNQVTARYFFRIIR